jgi:hypothetical protein
MVNAHREVETKYVAADGFSLPSLVGVVADPRGQGAACTVVAEGGVFGQRLVATYFDTADLVSALAGLTLRRRVGGSDAGLHLKVPGGGGGRMVLRRPLDRPTGTVPVALQQMMWVHTRGAALRPVATVVTNRTVRQLVDVTGRVLAEVADDRVTARRLGATAVPWRPGAWTTIWATAVLGTVAGRHLPPAVLLLGFSGVMIAAAAALVPRNRRSGGPATDPAAGPGDQATMTRPAARPRGVPRRGCPRGRPAHRVLRGGRWLRHRPRPRAGPRATDAVAAATSLVVVTVNSAVGLLARWGHLDIPWHVVAPFTAGAVLTSLLGARVASHLPAGLHNRDFVFLLVVVAGYVAVRGGASL